jgi:hypothetical protein
MKSVLRSASWWLAANNTQAGSLDNIGRRYSWFNRMMKTYDVEHASIFPSHWRVNEMLANSFCEGTREDFKSILQKSVRRGDGQTLDVDLLLSCLQETLNFEQGLERRFSNEVGPIPFTLLLILLTYHSHALQSIPSHPRMIVRTASAKPSPRPLNPI